MDLDLWDYYVTIANGAIVPLPMIEECNAMIDLQAQLRMYRELSDVARTW